jgi:hypothetical protein
VRTTTLQLIEAVKESSRKIGPYVLLELLLPGGTLFALVLFLYRRQASVGTSVARVRAVIAGRWERLRAALARRLVVGRTAEGGALRVEAASAATGARARRIGTRARVLRCRSSPWRLPSSIAVRCPALPLRA